ncbi:hypothetical protein [Agromyces laixinhei]|uniref:hypothetical protein n=1 Tax=Agromyces laixinhei TaxID=2585717 RepID=UPI0012ED2697|nr:hypothetical protein [Agromyces laixinhei]
MDAVLQLAEVVSAPKAPNLWGALGCALAYSGALFATIDSFADILLVGGDGPDGRMSPALKLKSGSKLSAAGITVIAAGLVLGLDANWFALGALSIAFVVLVGISALALVRHRRGAAAWADRASAAAEPAPAPAPDQPPLLGG